MSEILKRSPIRHRAFQSNLTNTFICFIDFKRRKEPVTSLLLCYKAERASQYGHGDAHRKRALKNCVICGGNCSRTADRRLNNILEQYDLNRRLACVLYFKVLWEREGKLLGET